jgi:hypothetical protein
VFPEAGWQVSTGHRLEGQSTSGRNKPEAKDKRKKKAYTSTNAVGGFQEALGDVWHAKEPAQTVSCFLRCGKCTADATLAIHRPGTLEKR